MRVDKGGTKRSGSTTSLVPLQRGVPDLEHTHFNINVTEHYSNIEINITILYATRN